jgi:hypothetical protein
MLSYVVACEGRNLAKRRGRTTFMLQASPKFSTPPTAAVSSKRCLTPGVVPGPAEGRSPEPISPGLSDIITAGPYGFRARRFAAPRNDGCGL